MSTAPTPTRVQPTPAERLIRHSRTRIVVLEDAKVAFLPMPKSGCTSMLWTLAGIAGHTREQFANSHQPEISRTLAIHNMRRWRPEEKWQRRTPEERAAILGADDWFRFTIVRDPVSRLWSAWQSKLLLQEPRFVDRFGSEPWFPADTSSVDAVVDSFRAFVRALDVDPAQAPHDAHWGSQVGLMAEFPATYVGRADQPAASLAALRAHLEKVGVDASHVADDVPRENANPIPFHPSVYDEETAAITARLFADDLAAWDFAAPAPSTDGVDAWRTLATDRLLLVNELIERHLRIGELLEELEKEKEIIREMREDHDEEPAAPLRRIAGRIGRMGGRG